MSIVPRPRTRAAPPQPKPRNKLAVWQCPRVGGPKGPFNMGRPLFDGQAFIGYRLDEYVTTKGKVRETVWWAGTDIEFVKTHAWAYRNGQLRYIGHFASRDVAYDRLLLLKSRAGTDQQPVAPAGRIRRVVPKT